MTASSTLDHPEFETDKLCNQPLLQSVYAETLRLYSAIFTLRSAQYGDFAAGGWIYTQNSSIVLSSYSAHMDKEAWHTGHGASHPVEEFWAERFLIYPGSASKKQQPDRSRTFPNTNSEASETTAAPIFSLKGKEDSWMPYGGGKNICPGRHFAKQEILLTVAILLARFDLELCARKGSPLKPDMKYFGLGTLPPKGRVPFRIRKRAFQ